MRFANLLEKGSIVAIEGPLGAGKTCFTKGIARGLCVEDTVTSPTYTIISEYEGKISGEPIVFYHINAYRLDGNDSFSAIGGEEIIYGNGVSVIEWSEHISDFIPPGAFRVEITIDDCGKRTIRLCKNGDSAVLGGAGK